MKSNYHSYDDETDYLLEDDYDDDNIPDIDLLNSPYYGDDYSNEYLD